MMVPQAEETKPKRTRGRRRSKAGRLCSEITPHELSMHYHQSIEVAAVEMRIGVTALKKLCRKFGVHKWPYRKFQRIVRLAGAAKAHMARPEDYQRLTELVLDPLLGEDSPLWSHADPQEQAIIRSVFEASKSAEFKQGMETGTGGGGGHDSDGEDAAVGHDSDSATQGALREMSVTVEAGEVVQARIEAETWSATFKQRAAAAAAASAPQQALQALPLAPLPSSGGQLAGNPFLAAALAAAGASGGLPRPPPQPVASNPFLAAALALQQASLPPSAQQAAAAMFAQASLPSAAQQAAAAMFAQASLPSSAQQAAAAVFAQASVSAAQPGGGGPAVAAAGRNGSDILFSNPGARLASYPNFMGDSLPFFMAALRGDSLAAFGQQGMLGLQALGAGRADDHAAMLGAPPEPKIEESTSDDGGGAPPSISPFTVPAPFLDSLAAAQQPAQRPQPPPELPPPAQPLALAVSQSSALSADSLSSFLLGPSLHGGLAQGSLEAIIHFLAPSLPPQQQQQQPPPVDPSAGSSSSGGGVPAATEGGRMWDSLLQGGLTQPQLAALSSLDFSLRQNSMNSNVSASDVMNNANSPSPLAVMCRGLNSDYFKHACAAAGLHPHQAAAQLSNALPYATAAQLSGLAYGSLPHHQVQPVSAVQLLHQQQQQQARMAPPATTLHGSTCAPQSLPLAYGGATR